MRYCFVTINVYRFLCLSFRIDIFSVVFLRLLGIVAFCVGIWSYYYMIEEETYKRFINLLIAFLVRIVLLIVSSNLFIAILGWDGLGVTSFLLVIYYKSRKRLGSGMITALTNRLGDCFFLCCLGFFLFDNALFLFLITLIRITKSAQFPFSS